MILIFCENEVCRISVLMGVCVSHFLDIVKVPLVLSFVFCFFSISGFDYHAMFCLGTKINAQYDMRNEITLSLNCYAADSLLAVHLLVCVAVCMCLFIFIFK